jgi:hypothetical protein
MTSGTHKGSTSSVVEPTCNRAELVKRCLGSFATAVERSGAEGRGERPEVGVVDDGRLTRVQKLCEPMGAGCGFTVSYRPSSTGPRQGPWVS